MWFWKLYGLQWRREVPQTFKSQCSPSNLGWTGSFSKGGGDLVAHSRLPSQFPPFWSSKRWYFFLLEFGGRPAKELLMNLGEGTIRGVSSPPSGGRKKRCVCVWGGVRLDQPQRPSPVITGDFPVGMGVSQQDASGHKRKRSLKSVVRWVKR